MIVSVYLFFQLQNIYMRRRIRHLIVIVDKIVLKHFRICRLQFPSFLRQRGNQSGREKKISARQKVLESSQGYAKEPLLWGSPFCATFCRAGVFSLLGTI